MRNIKLWIAASVGCACMLSAAPATQTQKNTMANDSMYMLNIAPMLMDHVEESAEDIAAMYRDGVITANAFIMTLNPEGEPMIDKAAILAERYKRLYAAVKARSSVPCGILLQATIGHGWTPDSPSKGQRFTLPDGSEPYIFCPLGSEFRTYIDHTIRTLAALKPDFFMLDDDFRMITGRGGCYCPLHLAGFNQRMGKHFERETLLAAIEQDVKLAEAWDAWQKETLDETAKLIRKAMDETVPGLECSFCMCAEDARHAPEITRSIAGNGPHKVRINNGLYMRADPRKYPEWTLYTARQIAYLPKDLTLLCEPDTCPQNRYSTSAALVHFHVTWSTLLGCRGAKLWITRTGAWEPKSGVAYREILAKYNGFHRTLASLNLKANGLCIPLPKESPLNLPYGVRNPYPVGNWATCDFGVTGFPFNFARADELSGIIALAGDDCDVLADDEIKEILSHNVLLDGEAVRKLTDRGFAPSIGVSARAWDLASPSYEQAPGRPCSSVGVWAKPVVFSILPEANAKVLSQLYHRGSGVSEDSELLSPGLIIVKRPAGNVIAMTASSMVPYGFQSFGRLNETHKGLMLEVLNELGGVPAIYAGDGEVMLWNGTQADGTQVVAMVNLGADTLEKPTFVVSRVPQHVEQLRPDGTWEEVAFTTDGQRITPNITLQYLMPVALRF